MLAIKDIRVALAAVGRTVVTGPAKAEVRAAAGEAPAVATLTSVTTFHSNGIP